MTVKRQKQANPSLKYLLFDSLSNKKNYLNSKKLLTEKKSF